MVMVIEQRFKFCLFLVLARVESPWFYYYNVPIVA